MRILTLASHLLHIAISEVTDPSFHFLRAKTWTEAHGILRELGVDSMIIDPNFDPPSNHDAFVSLREQYPQIPLVIFTQCTHDAINTTIRWAAMGPVTVVLHGLEDSQVRLVTAINQAVKRSSETTLVARFTSLGDITSHRLICTLMALFREPAQFTNVQDMARQSGMSRRALDRELQRLNIASALRLIRAAQLLRAFEESKNPGSTLSDAAKKSGYKSVRSMNRMAYSMTGQRLKQWCLFSREMFLESLFYSLGLEEHTS